MAVRNGTPGNDTLVGTPNADLIRGFAGNDILRGLAGPDTIEGGNGNDTVEGGNGNDTLRGDSGSDRFIGGAGNDTFNGGTGIDTANYSSLAQAITLLPQGDISKGSLNTDSLANVEKIIGAAGRTNIINASSASGGVSLTVDLEVNSLTVNNIPGIGSRSFTVQNFVNVIGTSNGDTITGNSFNNILRGNGGNDTVAGRSGNDTLEGENGTDFLDGGLGNDLLDGGTGNDTLQSGRGDDRLTGGSGNDLLIGVFPNGPIPPGLGEFDSLIGGTGADRFALGDRASVFYDDNNTTSPGFEDLATIRDFSSFSGDRIELKGTPADYLLQSAGGNTRILLDKPGGEQSELIGVVQGTSTLGLDSNDFRFFEAENAGQATNNTLASAEGLGTLGSGSDVDVSAELATVQPGSNPDFDFFRFSLASSKTVTLRTELSGDSGPPDTVLGLFNSAGNLLESDDDSGPGVESLITASLGAGTYSISVSDFGFLPQDGGTFTSGSFDPGPYSLQVTVA